MTEQLRVIITGVPKYLNCLKSDSNDKYYLSCLFLKASAPARLPKIVEEHCKEYFIENANKLRDLGKK